MLSMWALSSRTRNESPLKAGGLAVSTSPPFIRAPAAPTLVRARAAAHRRSACYTAGLKQGSKAVVNELLQRAFPARLHAGRAAPMVGARRYCSGAGPSAVTAGPVFGMATARAVSRLAAAA